KVYFHRLGQRQSEDTLLYERPDQKEWGFFASVTDDGHYLVISVWSASGPKNLVYWQDLTAKNAPIVPLIDTFESKYAFIDNDGPIFWFQTDHDSARGRVIAIDVGHPDRAAWK